MAVVFMLAGLLLCGVIVLYALLYVMHGRPRHVRSDVKLLGNTVIVTGGSSGIGKATALDLACRGARVIIASRDHRKGQSAAWQIQAASGNADVRHEQLDLSDFQSVRKFVDRILYAETKLDILINNAAIAYHKDTVTSDGYEMVFGTNYLGHFLLTYLLLDLLKQSAPSRIINVSSMSHSFMPTPLRLMVKDVNKFGDKFYPYLEGYEYSKQALILHTKELGKILAGTGVIANSLHPGMVLTDLWKGMEAQIGHRLFSILTLALRPLFMSAEAAAQTTIYCAVSPEVQYITGRYFKNCQLSRESWQARDPLLAQELWNVSKLLTGCCLKCSHSAGKAWQSNNSKHFQQEMMHTLVPENCVHIDRT